MAWFCSLASDGNMYKVKKSPISIEIKKWQHYAIIQKFLTELRFMKKIQQTAGL